MSVTVFPISIRYDKTENKWRKNPRTGKGVSWQGYKPKNPDSVYKWVNWGVVCPRGYVFFDLDRYKGVDEPQVEKALGCSLDWEAAHLQDTPGGGDHYAFKIPLDVCMKNAENALGVKGFDIRAPTKGWIATGEKYNCPRRGGLRGDSLLELDLPYLPQEVINLLRSEPDIIDKGAIEHNDGQIEMLPATILDDDEDLDVLLGLNPTKHGFVDLTNEDEEDEEYSFDSFEIAVANQPLGRSLQEIKWSLDRLPDSYADTREQWVMVGMAIHIESGGSSEGLALWDEFSQRCPEKYDSRVLEQQWLSFKHKRRPVTFRTIEHITGRMPMPEPDFEQLREKCSRIDTLAKKRQTIANLEEFVGRMTDDEIDELVTAIVSSPYGKQKGIRGQSVRKQLVASKRKSEGQGPTKAQLKLALGGKMPKWLEGWYFVANDNRFVSPGRNKVSLVRDAFDMFHSDKNFGNMRPSKYALEVAGMKTVLDAVFNPREDAPLYEKGGVCYLNKYVDKRIRKSFGYAPTEAGRKAIDAFLTHVAFVIPENDSRYLLDFLAHVFRNPAVRMNYAIVFQGVQGCGKTYFAQLMGRLMGEDSVSHLDPTAIHGRFTGWADEAILICVEEINIRSSEKWEILDRMKPFISNDRIQIEEKGRDHKTVDNFSSYLFLTNHKDAIPLGDDDRRYCIIFGRHNTREQLEEDLTERYGSGQRYFEELFGSTIYNEDGVDALAWWFEHEYQISKDFNPKGVAPMTNSKELMIRLATSPERSNLEDFIDYYESEGFKTVNSTIFSPSIADIIIEKSFDTDSPNYDSRTKALRKILLEMGYTLTVKRKLTTGGKRRQFSVWTKTDLPDDYINLALSHDIARLDSHSIDD